MIASRVAAREGLGEVIEDYASDQDCQEVLLFLGRHPRTRFSRLAIIHALNGYRLDTEQALNRLTSEGVVRRYIENGVLLYSMSIEE